MIKVIANEYIKAECVDDFLRMTKDLVEKTNALDPGCIKYELCRDLNDPSHFVMLEEWEDQKSIDAHMKADHFVNTVPKFGAFAIKPSEITILAKVH